MLQKTEKVTVNAKCKLVTLTLKGVHQYLIIMANAEQTRTFLNSGRTVNIQHEETFMVTMPQSQGHIYTCITL
jgi:hypothetical protein